jgi:hypothetical protein
LFYPICNGSSYPIRSGLSYPLPDGAANFELDPYFQLDDGCGTLE